MLYIRFPLIVCLPNYLTPLVLIPERGSTFRIDLSIRNTRIMALQRRLILDYGQGYFGYRLFVTRRSVARPEQDGAGGRGQRQMRRVRARRAWKPYLSLGRRSRPDPRPPGPSGSIRPRLTRGADRRCPGRLVRKEAPAERRSARSGESPRTASRPGATEGRSACPNPRVAMRGARCQASGKTNLPVTSLTQIACERENRPFVPCAENYRKEPILIAACQLLCLWAARRASSLAAHTGLLHHRGLVERQPFLDICGREELGRAARRDQTCHRSVFDSRLPPCRRAHRPCANGCDQFPCEDAALGSGLIASR